MCMCVCVACMCCMCMQCVCGMHVHVRVHMCVCMCGAHVCVHMCVCTRVYQPSFGSIDAVHGNRRESYMHSCTLFMVCLSVTGPQLTRVIIPQSLTCLVTPECTV